MFEVGLDFVWWWLSSSFGMHRLGPYALPNIRTQVAALVVVLLNDQQERAQNMFLLLSNTPVRIILYRTTCLQLMINTG